MARFTLTRLDEHGFTYPVWESDDIDEARDQLDSLMAVLDEAIQPRSGQLEEIIRDLKGQIDEAEAGRRWRTADHNTHFSSFLFVLNDL